MRFYSPLYDILPEEKRKEYQPRGTRYRRYSKRPKGPLKGTQTQEAKAKREESLKAYRQEKLKLLAATFPGILAKLRKDQKGQFID